MAEIFHGFHEFLQTNSGVVPQIQLRPSAFHLLFNSLYHSALYRLEVLTASLNKINK